jgi:hypothetical protein
MNTKRVREILESFSKEAVSLYWRDFWELLGTLYVVHKVNEMEDVIKYINKLVENPQMDKELIEFWINNAKEKKYEIHPLSLAIKLKKKLEGKKVCFD